MTSRATRLLTSLAAVPAAAFLLLSCGGPRDGVTGPSAVQPDGEAAGRPAGAALASLELDLDVYDGDVAWSADDPDGISASCRGKLLICHKRKKTLWVSHAALMAHLRHGDSMGACPAPPPKPKPTPTPAPTPTPTPPAPAQCPCFSRSDIEAAASQCGNLNASCPTTFSLGLFCAPGGSTGTVGNLGYWEAVAGQESCSRTIWDPLTGDPMVQTLPVDALELEACRAEITTSSPYPASCPR
jgi:hypothetical protein